MNTTEKLKPCPFCGGEAKKKTKSGDERTGYANYVYVECQSCFVVRGATGDTSKPGYADNSTVEARAIAAWNSRVSAPTQEQPYAWEWYEPCNEFNGYQGRWNLSKTKPQGDAGVTQLMALYINAAPQAAQPAQDVSP